MAGIPDIKGKYKIILVWFIINTVLGMIIALSISLSSELPILKIFIVSEINSHTISVFSSVAGYYFGEKFKHKPLYSGIFLTLIGVYPFSLIGISICVFTTSSIIHMGDNYIRGILLLSIVLTTVITLITTVIERLRSDRRNLESDLESIIRDNSSKSKSGSGKILVKEKENFFTLDTDRIIYLSSHGKKTVIHSEGRDSEVSQLIKEIEVSLDPEHFIRVHKQYIINVNYLSHIQHYSGGGYLAYLKDEDENTIPVGRTYIASLKERMNLSR